MGGPPQAAPQQAAPVGDGFSGITGDLVDGRFSEKEAKPIANQNSKLLRVRLGEPVPAERLGRPGDDLGAGGGEPEQEGGHQSGQQ